MKILTQFDGWTLIALFFVVMSAIVLCLRKITQTKAEFLAAGHSAPWLLTAFSMAATWVWAPSMFTAAQNPDDYPGYEVAKKVYARCTEATTVKTYQKMYQVLLAGDPKCRSYRVLVGDLYRDIQNRDKNKKYGRT